MLMDADNIILLAQFLSNRYMPVCRFTIGFLGQDRGQRSLSAKLRIFLIFVHYMFLSAKSDQTQESLNVYMCKKYFG